tara:strand:- start:456 stop:632 length:177 start_codon:yes stop_codon:yes gene_type:complete
MKNFLVQVTVYGFATIQAESIEDAEEKGEEMRAKDFDMSKDCDTDVLYEVDENGTPID